MYLFTYFKLLFLKVCVASKRKSIQVYTVREDHMNVVKDISVSEIPLNMVRNHQGTSFQC